ncbi:hypothetical protein AZI86_06940 [Bdellovibrio bacteriovorus]|uniref:Asparaginase n=1 Tax=Bdellovibrio bacteriovorus TaxID=959 RepID=A0A150WQL2_BDEBC|nr:asparaginase [Bdellovibrio bacteriovorus]KYG66771.1 hypothetical protein AZI86_06940 [Bdellovibrio bacteriovorus]
MKIVVERGSHVESMHQVSYVVMDPQGKILDSSGDVEEKFFPRSAIKMIQVLPLVRFKRERGLPSSPHELACACASHAGEKVHIEIVSSWLERLSLKESHLICGAHLPFNETAAKFFIQNNEAPTRLHNNCSGKHTGMLEWARLLNASVENYADINHPVQQSIRTEMQTMAEIKMQNEDWAIDGCGIPAWRMPLKNIATMLWHFSSEAAIKGSAEEEVFQACVQNPVLTAGSDEFCTQAMKQLSGEVFLKVGAEGFMTAILPHRKKVIVLKVHDGAERASEVAISHLLARHVPEMKTALSAWTEPPLFNWAGTAVGRIKAI